MISFTVITCTYNCADYLHSTLDSILRQTYPLVEHLIIDGCSTDSTYSTALAYKHKSDEESMHEVRTLSEPDHGLYDAMNKGLALATGDYVVFMNAGDTFHAQDTLEIVAGCIGEGEEQPAVLYGDTHIVDINGRFLRRRRLEPPTKLTWRSFMKGMLVCHQSFYARCDLAKSNPYDLRLKLSADVDWCIRIMKQAKQQKLALRNVNHVLTDYLDGGMSQQRHRASLIERFQVMARHYGIIPTLVMHLWFVIRARIKK